MTKVKGNISVEILDECSKYVDWFVERLQDYVDKETPPHEKEAHLDFFDLIKQDLNEADYDSVIYPAINSGGTLFGRKRSNSKNGYQLMLGHADTVWPESTINRMPFEKEGNILKGPGIYDMKAGLLMMITALKIIKKMGLRTSLAPLILISSDEETGSRESKENIIRIAKVVDRVFVLEPSLDPDGKLKTRRKGVGHYDIKIKGVSSHAGIEPEKGKSAILELSYLIQKLHKLNNPEKGVTINVGTINGGISTNVVAPESSASVDVRVMTKKDGREVHEKIMSLEPTTNGVTFEIDGGIERPPLVQNERNRKLWNAAERIADELELNLNQGISGGGSDGSYTSLYTATLDGLGAVGEGAHSPTEKIYLEETIRRIALLTRLLLEDSYT